MAEELHGDCICASPREQLAYSIQCLDEAENESPTSLEVVWGERLDVMLAAMDDGEIWKYGRCSWKLRSHAWEVLEASDAEGACDSDNDVGVDERVRVACDDVAGACRLEESAAREPGSDASSEEAEGRSYVLRFHVA